MKTVVVTGIGRGLGKAIHDLLCDKKTEQYHFVFVSRRSQTALQSSENITYVNLDFDEPAFDTDVLTINPHSDCVIFVNNAGIVEPIMPAAAIDFYSFEHAIRVNCWAPLKICRHLAALSLEHGIPLNVINISSGAASRAIRGWLAYCVSKASAKMSLDVLAAENPHVSVTHFDPGVMDTDMQGTIRAQSPDVMPDVGVFIGFKDNLRLKETSAVAAEVIQMFGVEK